MDNLTHSLAGLLLAEAALVWPSAPGRVPSRALRWAACAASITANNFPDADFLYTGITEPRALGYLLHHRGHTHTLLIALLLGALTFGLALAGLRVFRAKLAPGDRLRVLVLSLGGPLVHIAMDFMNNYGVHPFWPLHDAWFYGDSVFIVEPWLWVALLPVLAFSAQSSVARAILAILSLAALVLAWTHSLVPWGAALALTLGGALATYACSRLAPRARVALGLAGTFLVIAVFASGSRLAQANVERALEPEGHAGATIADVIVTPTPANPLCASAIVIGTRGGSYFVRKAVSASVPALFPAARCRVEPSTPTARFVHVSAKDTSAVAWQGEWSAPLGELEQLSRENCQVNALLRFTRAPYWVRQDEGWIVGDARYDRAPGVDFADLTTAARPSRCPAWVPPWTPPRSDVIVN